ncbi:E3 ubiquitin protein ligase RIE1 [Trifolium repens]|nr:E3 ubiquitin protein ligase RIE1 [Trifolium repens]
MKGWGISFFYLYTNTSQQISKCFGSPLSCPFQADTTTPQCREVFINKISNQCIASSDIKFAERASCFCPKPPADACAMKMVGTGKLIQFCSINIWT